MSADNKHPANMAYLGALFDFRSHHESGSIAKGQKRQTMGIAQLHETYGFQALTFFLAARQRSELDKNVSPFSQAFRSLVLQYAGFSDIGLHPSDFSNTHPECLLKEKQLLEGLLISKDGYIRDSGEIVVEAQTPKPEQPRLFE